MWKWLWACLNISTLRQHEGHQNASLCYNYFYAGYHSAYHTAGLTAGR